MNNLIGRRYGRLLVVSRADSYVSPSGARRTRWNCVCDCGNNCTVQASLLTNGGTRSCGCLRAEQRVKDISGQRFGRLVAVERTGETRNNSCVWRFACDCGNVVECEAELALWGNKRSCGCLARETKAGHAVAMQKNCLRVGGTDVNKISSQTIPKNNTSGIRGVYWHKGTKMWTACIGFKGRTYYLGYRSDKSEAAKLRKAAEEHLYGEFLAWYYAEHPDKTPKDKDRRRRPPERDKNA